MIDVIFVLNGYIYVFMFSIANLAFYCCNTQELIKSFHIIWYFFDGCQEHLKLQVKTACVHL